MRKILIAFGLIWVFVWCGVGFYVGSQHMPHIQEMEKLAQEGNLEDFWSTLNAWKMRATSHSHALCFTSLLILVALVMPDMRFSDRAKNVLGVLLIVGVVSSTIFGWFHFLPLIPDFPDGFVLMARFVHVLPVIRGFPATLTEAPGG